MHYKALTALVHSIGGSQKNVDAFRSQAEELRAFIERGIPLIANQVRADARDRDTGELCRTLYVLENFRDLVETPWKPEIANDLGDLLALYVERGYLDVNDPRVPEMHLDGTLLEQAIARGNIPGAAALIMLGSDLSLVPRHAYMLSGVASGDFEGFLRIDREPGHPMITAMNTAIMNRSIARSSGFAPCGAAVPPKHRRKGL
ncbi:hypothetical protein [Hydrogenophaga sp. 2FB]|uniref:hypothetical protein n=1 Tax=Hydrogenophaga sp. 2FB TaxID=2502187 RepID=UPI0010F8967F|nr:hypothetical protein [Hydrogenophaga sp. 2FB]